MAFNILKYIYNLILTTLGIDNPFVIERTSEPVDATTYTRSESMRTRTGATLTKTTRYKGGN